MHSQITERQQRHGKASAAHGGKMLPSNPAAGYN
jgi:hypothetical protein